MPPRVLFASWVWIIISVMGLLLCSMNVLFFCVVMPATIEKQSLALFFTFICCLLYRFGRNVRSKKVTDILIPCAYAMSLGFLAQLYATANILAKRIPHDFHPEIENLLNRPPADLCLVAGMGTLLLLTGLLALTQRQQYRHGNIATLPSGKDS